MSDELGLEELGAFVDTQGAGPRVKRAKKGGDEVEEQLESLVFGRQLFPRAEEDSSSEESDGDDDAATGSHAGRHSSAALSATPAWHDEDDEAISVDISARQRLRKLRTSESETTISGAAYHKRLRTQFEKLQGQPEWAKLHPERKRRQGRNDDDSDATTSGSEDEEEDDILRRTGSLLAPSSELLPKGLIDIKRLKDANTCKQAQAVIRAVEFHPSSSVLLTAGYHKTLDLFQVDGQVNPVLQSVHLERFPISTAHFTADGQEIIMAGKRKSFFVYDMMAGKITQIHGIRGREERFFDKFVVSPDNELLVFLGKDGYMPLVSNKTKQWVADLKMNGRVRGVAFTSDGKRMLSIGSDGKVYVWDMATRDCVHCFTDDGCVLGNTVAVSPSGRYVACGSDSGVVNLYDDQCFTNERPKPLKAVMNLTTAIDQTVFNSSSEILALTSQRKKDAMKLLHLPSLTVFSNWPTAKTPLAHVTAVDISPLSRFVAIGNDKGKVLLYRLNHFFKGA